MSADLQILTHTSVAFATIATTPSICQTQSRTWLGVLSLFYTERPVTADASVTVSINKI